MKTPLPRCHISTDQGQIEADEGCLDFARLAADLTRRGPGQIEFVRLEHPSGGVLTLGAKTSRDGERLLRFRHVQADGVIQCTKRVEERPKLVGQLSEFFATGARGNHLAWIPTSSLIFDAEEANTRLRQQPHYPSALQNANQEPLRFNRPASGAWKEFMLPFAGVLLLILWGQSCADKEAKKQNEAAERAAERAEWWRKHDEEKLAKGRSDEQLKARPAAVQTSLKPNPVPEPQVMVANQVTAEALITRLNGIQFSGGQRNIKVSMTISDAAIKDSTLAFCLSTLTEAPAGTHSVRADYQMPLSALRNAKRHVEDTGLGAIKFIVEAPGEQKPFAVKVREYSTGAYAGNTTQGAPIEGREAVFGFTFKTQAEATDFLALWERFVGELTAQSAVSVDPATVPIPEESPSKTIIGSTAEEVGGLLNGWATRKSNRWTAARPIVYYIKDVEIIVSYRDGKAVGVAVIDKPGSGISPIPPSRFTQLVALIGGQPKANDVSRDASGIREFSVGDAD